MTHKVYVPTVLSPESGGGWAPEPLRMLRNRTACPYCELGPNCRSPLFWQSHYSDWAISVDIGIVDILFDMYMSYGWGTHCNDLVTRPSD